MKKKEILEKILRYKWRILIAILFILLIGVMIYIGWDKFWKYWSDWRISDMLTIISPMIIGVFGESVTNKINKTALREKELVEYNKKCDNIIIELDNIRSCLYNKLESGYILTNDIVELKKIVDPLLSEFPTLFNNDLKKNLQNFKNVLDQKMEQLNSNLDTNKKRSIVNEILTNINNILPLIKKVGIEHE